MSSILDPYREIIEACARAGLGGDRTADVLAAKGVICDPVTVYKFCRRHKIRRAPVPWQRRKLTLPQRLRLYQELAEGLTWAAAAERFGISTVTIAKYIYKFNDSSPHLEIIRHQGPYGAHRK